MTLIRALITSTNNKGGNKRIQAGYKALLSQNPCVYIENLARETRKQGKADSIIYFYFYYFYFYVYKLKQLNAGFIL